MISLGKTPPNGRLEQVRPVLQVELFLDARPVGFHRAHVDMKGFRHLIRAAPQADQFKNQLLAYQAAPDVYKARSYLQPFMNISTNVRFFVKTTTNRNDLFQLDLQEKITADMSDLVIPGKK